MSQINLKDIQQKLYEKLKPSGWGDKLKMFILSNDFYVILEHLLAESQGGDKFTPVLKQLFRAFEECPYDELKVVMLNQDVYPKAGIADGLAFSTASSNDLTATLKYLLKEVGESVYQDDNYEYNPDLDRWSKQGVLLLNTSLTTTIGKMGSHVELWRPFITYLLDILASYNTGLVYVFVGDKVKKWSQAVPQNNYKFFTQHPALAAYKGAESWDSGNLFNQINKIVDENYKTKIKW